VKKTLHLTHTDIAFDSRILKEMNSLSTEGYIVSGLGVAMEEGNKRSDTSAEIKVDAIKLRSRQLTWLPRTVRHLISLAELMAKMLPAAIRQRPNIIHCHDTLVLPIGVVSKIFTGSKLIYDAHELESNRNGLSRLQGILTLTVEKLLWPFVDGLIVVSPSIQKWYMDNLGSKSSTIVMNAPYFEEDEAKGSSYLREKFHIPQDQLVFIYVGILGHGRGLELITEAFTQPDISSHVIFLGYGELLPHLRTLESQHKNIHIHDAVPHAQVVPITRSADFGLCLIGNVSLSDYYCLPNKLFEYCFSGVPVLASDFPDIQAVVDAYGIGECCSPEPVAATRAIKSLATTPKRFKFADLWPLSWQAQEKKLKELYASLLAPPSISS
jgi:glycosyltransferase involved in cell wall biosynthesis